MTDPVCRVCGTDLTSDNWHSSKRKGNRYICKACASKYAHEWYIRNRSSSIERAKKWQREHPYESRAKNTRSRRKHGVLALTDNKSCALYLGIHVAERVLSLIFKNVERKPLHNPGYDFICNKGKKIDVKSACLRTTLRGWKFHIGQNTIADFFLCLAFDNRKDLNPLHIWLIPGGELSHLKSASISISTIQKWDEYRLDISKVVTCCNELRYFEPDPNYGINW